MLLRWVVNLPYNGELVGDYAKLTSVTFFISMVSFVSTDHVGLDVITCTGVQPCKS